MNPLHLEELANARVADLRRHAAVASHVSGAFGGTQAPDPRVPRRGPLASIARLGLFVRTAIA